MIWPFKRKPVRTFEEAIAEEPMPLCGNKEKHYMWKWNGVACPLCAAKRQRQEQRETEERMANLIAVRVAAILKDKP